MSSAPSSRRAGSVKGPVRPATHSRHGGRRVSARRARRGSHRPRRPPRWRGVRTAGHRAGHPAPGGEVFRRGDELVNRFQFVADRRHPFEVKRLCEVLDMARSSLLRLAERRARSHRPCSGRRRAGGADPHDPRESAYGLPEARRTPLTSDDQRLRRSGIIVVVRNARHPQGRAMIRFDLKPGFGHDGAAQRELRIKEQTRCVVGLHPSGPQAEGHEGERRDAARRCPPNGNTFVPTRLHQTRRDPERQSGGGERRAPA